MPTDGANFLFRKPLYGALYTAAKNGASDSELSQLGVAGMAREYTKTTLPFFSEMVDAAIGARNSLFNFNGREFLKDLRERLQPVTQNSNAGEVAEDIQDSVLRSAGKIRESSATLSDREYSEKLLNAIGCDLFQKKVVDDSAHYISYKRGCLPEAAKEIGANMTLFSQDAVGTLMKSIYDSPLGKPGKALKQVGSKIDSVDCGSADSLNNTCLTN